MKKTQGGREEGKEGGGRRKAGTDLSAAWRTKEDNYLKMKRC